MEETYFNLEIDRNEVYRYLGAGQTAPSSVLGELAEECIGMIRNTARPARYFRIFPCAGNGETEVRIGPLTVMSRALVRNLDGCREVCLFGATLGAGVDRLIARAQAKGEMTRALALQAAGAAMLEAFCDKTEEEIRRAAAAQSGRSAEEVFLRPRFSPGYGDFGLEYQRDLFRILFPLRAGSPGGSGVRGDRTCGYTVQPRKHLQQMCENGMCIPKTLKCAIMRL